MDLTPQLEDLVGHPLPDSSLIDDEGRPYRLRQHVGQRSFALFFYIRNGTPG